MMKIKFEYRDEWCLDGKFHEQECICESLEQCKKFYGLDQCEHRIISVKEIRGKQR